MNIFQPRRGSVDLDLEQDYISNLPINIKEEILVKLPIEEAVRTSLLSTKWKYTWMSIPNLVFIEYYSQSRLIRLVSQVLLLHRGSILQFKLDTRHVCDEAIDRWMLILSRNGIKNLYMKLNPSEKCLIPSSFFSCLVLEHVHIYWGTIHVPLSFQGFKFLRILRLFSCNFPGTIARLISSCPLLESLDLDGFVEFGRLVIHAPNLRWLSISGEFDDLCLETPKLRVAYVIPDGNFGISDRDRKSDILRVFGSLSAIEELELRSDFISYLAKGPIPEMLPVPLCRLTKLHVVLHSYKEEIAAACCLFKNAPNLKVLSFKLHDEKSYSSSSLARSFWEEKGIESDLFNCLEIVNIPCFQYPESVLNVSKFVLRTAPVLEKLVIVECCVDVLMDGMAFLKKLACFPRLSKMARIEFVEDF